MELTSGKLSRLKTERHFVHTALMRIDLKIRREKLTLALETMSGNENIMKALKISIGGDNE